MRQLIRYSLIGIVSNLAMYFVYLLMTFIGIEPKKAMTLLYIIGASIGFVGNRQWTFAHRGVAYSAVLRYVMAHILGYLLNFMILSTFVDRLGFAHQWIQAAAIIIVAGFLFVVFKYFVFRPSIALSNNKSIPEII